MAGRGRGCHTEVGPGAAVGALATAAAGAEVVRDDVLAEPAEVAVRSAAKSGWAPGFIDYLYVSVTNSSAFSPTDTMPLSPRAKMLMAVESVSALLLSILVISRGVSLLQ